ncbi:MAG: sulfite exporter TauE/SafE family protein [Polyangiaceae bacterium]
MELDSLRHHAAVIAIGAVVGFVSGLLGKGGSAVTTPALRVLLDVPRFIALASPLPAALPTTLSASLAYRGRGLIDWTAFAITCAVGLPATILGSFASPLVGGHTLMLLTALFVTGLGISMFFHKEAAETREDVQRTPARRARLAVIGLLVGFLAGLLANTGGVLYAPLFIQWVRMETKRALATSLVVASALAIPGTIVHAALGHVDWSLVVALAIGGIPSSYFGARVALRLRSDTLLRIYGVALTAFGLYDLLYTEREAILRLFGHGS